ncbi:MAG: hypothetical protein ACT4N4_16105, partial [Rhodospirillales bacterium]
PEGGEKGSICRMDSTSRHRWRSLRLSPTAVGGAIVAMSQVGPEEAEINLCKWPRKIFNMPEACLHGFPSDLLLIIATLIAMGGVVWFFWERLRKMEAAYLISVGIAIAFVGLIIATIGAWQQRSVAHQATPVPVFSPPALAMPIPQSKPAPQREFVNRTPSELLALHNGVTPIQAAKLLEPFKGLWIETEVVVGDRILPDTPKDHTYGYFGLPGNPNIGMVECRFDERWINHVSRLMQGEILMVRGKIGPHQTTRTLFLQECEIVRMPAARIQ